MSTIFAVVFDKNWLILNLCWTLIISVSFEQKDSIGIKLSLKSIDLISIILSGDAWNSKKPLSSVVLLENREES